jgi:hypothetical protein
MTAVAAASCDRGGHSLILPAKLLRVRAKEEAMALCLVIIVKRCISLPKAKTLFPDALHHQREDGHHLRVKLARDRVAAHLTDLRHLQRARV